MNSDNIHKVFVTLGASNHTNAERESNDYYATDPVAAEHLLNLETFAKDIWEPACGGGGISQKFSKNTGIT